MEEMKYLFSIVFALWGLQVDASGKDSCEWIFIYYVPYDNNLSSYADSILNQLSSTAKNENVRVVFQVDKNDTLGMYRYTLDSEGIHTDTMPSEQSTSGKQLSSYLNWVHSNFSFKKTTPKGPNPWQ